MDKQKVYAHLTKAKSYWVPAGFVLVAISCLYIGIGIGNGSIALGKDAVFKESVQSKDVPKDLNYASVERVYDKIRASYDGKLDNEKLLDGLKAGLAQATGDTYTEYLSVKDAKAFNEQLTGTFSGIGAELSKDENGTIIVIAPISGYPAEKAGVRAKDLIVSVNDEKTTGWTVDQAVTKIRGEAGTKVKIKVVRDAAKELEFEITREQIKIPSVESEMLDGNVGYIKISRFGEDTVELTQQAATKFKESGVKGVILDVRGDPGGLLDASVGVSSLWLDPGQTVLLEKRGGVTIKTFKAKGSPTLKGIPTVVLINEGSASASEITAGALRDNKAATLIGVKSFGKGSVQQLEPLGDGSMIKITIARWFTPSGKGIDKEGIEPDNKVERTEEDFKSNKDPQKDAAIDFLKSKQ